ncbi:hypothetical protein Hbl1158_13185 [Halobaculum sp. CBA1158]|uniref:hypothetical protein n=1 Tax=Halobaculum sp. CBA1158 TaxID=2904243 RepID=UPI001F1DA5F7|nr:hypothetical protein [Halobaculum sp. CBA1158]UIO99467.1 hypothetical protein Hbl1158_13185 [Halobaculum sp. CBA1158]
MVALLNLPIPNGFDTPGHTDGEADDEDHRTPMAILTGPAGVDDDSDGTATVTAT